MLGATGSDSCDLRREAGTPSANRPPSAHPTDHTITRDGGSVRTEGGQEEVLPKVLPSWASCHFCCHRFPDVSAVLTLAQQRVGLLCSSSVPGSGSWGSPRRGPPDCVTPPRRPCPLTFDMCGVMWMPSTGLTDDKGSREAIPLGEFLWLGGSGHFSRPSVLSPGSCRQRRAHPQSWLPSEPGADGGAWAGGPVDAD